MLGVGLLHRRSRLRLLHQNLKPRGSLARKKGLLGVGPLHRRSRLRLLHQNPKPRGSLTRKKGLLGVGLLHRRSRLRLLHQNPKPRGSLAERTKALARSRTSTPSLAVAPFASKSKAVGKFGKEEGLVGSGPLHRRSRLRLLHQNLKQRGNAVICPTHQSLALWERWRAERDGEGLFV